MQAIYEPTGKALEYGALACNLYRGCAHGCTYCYAPSILRMDRGTFSEAKPRPGILGALRKDAAKHRGKNVFLCFTTDPYQGGGPATREAIQVLKEHDCTVTILSKAGKASTRDFDLLGAGDSYGATLTFMDPKLSLEWEPFAALPSERLDALREAKANGIKTWASLEPVIDPAQSLEIIRVTSSFVDKYKVGKWNHDKRAAEIDWRSFVQEAVSLLVAQGSDYMLKQDLLPYA